MTTTPNLLKFIPFKSQVDPSFWQRLTELKLEVDKLTENVHQIWGYYSNKKPEGQNQLFSVDASSFNKLPDENRVYGVGSIINKNTLESFKQENKLELLKAQGREMMKIIKEEAIKDPTPTFISCTHVLPPKNIKEILNDKQISALCEAYMKRDSGEARGFFFVRLEQESLEMFSLKQGLAKLRLEEDWFLGFADTSDSRFPSWPLRNYIALVAYHHPELLEHLKIICLRMNFHEGQWRADNSIVLNVTAKLEDNAWEKAESGESWIGWEKNEKGRMGPRLANLKHFMDPASLAESSVDLNLKLMKWQILPELNLDVVKESKCLLIGAGTLGCAIARNLMSWGVRHITFIDYGTVSYSNPVRQFLYKFKDTGSSKAETAAAALKEIFPGMTSTGFAFAVPMPGHPVGDSLLEETKRNVEKLEGLLDEHDAVFLLMDSRESRWLPTLVAAAKGKLVINAALGFDSYLVMRHGTKNPTAGTLSEGENSKLLTGDRLGCYFCSDVTAPGNSFRGRTLDQQCTVTRPGVSNMAGALAVELFVSVLQHPLGGFAPAETNPESKTSGSLLGIVPHSIRGFISHYQTVLPAVEAFSCCVACSPKVINTYKEEGFGFILKALESKEFLEELCGLTELQNEPVMTEVLEYSDSDGDE